jgi:hypothetical protein
LEERKIFKFSIAPGFYHKSAAAIIARCLRLGDNTGKGGSGGTSLIIGSQDTNANVASFSEESILVIRDEDIVNDVDDGRAASVNVESSNLYVQERNWECVS